MRKETRGCDRAREKEGKGERKRERLEVRERERDGPMEWGQFVTRPPVEAASSYFLFAVCAYLYPPLIRSTYYVGEPPTDDRGHGYLRNYVLGSL